MWTKFIRILTACVVVGPAFLAIYFGAQIVMFASARWMVERHPDEAVLRLDRWFAMRGLAFASRSAAIKSQYSFDLLQDQFIQMLTHSPLSSKTWSALAGLEIVSGASFDRAVQALTMSAITGPNEIALMSARAKIGLTLWEVLPPERRKGIAMDIYTADRWGYFNDDKANLLAILNSKSEHIRVEIRQQLMQIDALSDVVLADLGLLNVSVDPKEK